MMNFDVSQFQYWYWLILAIALFIVEVLMPGAFCLWIGIAAVIAGAASYFLEISLNLQILLFAVMSIVVTIFGRHFYKPLLGGAPLPTLNRRIDQLIGKQFILTEPVVGGIGHISINDAIWKVKGDDVPAGTLVEVARVEGNVLVIKEVK